MKFLSTDNTGIEEAVARVREITNRLNNVSGLAAMGNGDAGTPDATGPRLGINSEGVSTIIAGTRITSRQKEDILRRLEEIRSLLDKMKSGKDYKNKIRVLVDSFRGAEIVIRTHLIANRFIAQIMSR
jgi:hypothetical protein